MKRVIWLHVVAVALTWSTAALAQEQETTGASHEAEYVYEDPFGYLNAIGLFGGVTMKHDESGAGTLALEYVRKFRHENRIQPFWVGVAAEFVFEEHTEYLALVMAYWRPPHTHAWIRTGPGAEWTQEESHEAGHEGSTETTTDFVYRLGAGYTMELGEGIGLSPSLDFDFVRSTVAVVFGFAVEYGF